MNDSFLNSANAPYVAELYFKYTQNPKSIDDSWKSFFSSLNEDELSVLSDFGGPEWKKRDTNIIDDISFDKEKPMTLKELERIAILAGLERTNWNMSTAATQLGISRMTLYRKLTQHNLDKNG